MDTTLPLMSQDEINKKHALDHYKRVRTSSAPFIVGYYSSNHVLLTGMNKQALDLLKYPEEAQQKKVLSSENEPIAQFFEGESYQRLKTCSTSEIELSLNPYTGHKKVMAKVRCYPWGCWIILGQGPSKDIKIPDIGDIAKSIDKWTKFSESLKKLWTIVLPGVIGLWAFISTIAPWLPDIPLPPPFVRKQANDVKKTLESELVQYPTPPPVFIGYWAYTDYFRSVECKELVSNLIQPAVFDHPVRVGTDGWKDAFAAHLNRNPFTIQKESFSGEHPIRVLFEDANISDLVTTPVFKNGVLVGFIGVGYRLHVSNPDFARMRSTAILISTFVGPQKLPD